MATAKQSMARAKAMSQTSMCVIVRIILLKIRQIPVTETPCKYVILNIVKNLKATSLCVQYDRRHLVITTLSFYSIQKYINLQYKMAKNDKKN